MKNITELLSILRAIRLAEKGHNRIYHYIHDIRLLTHDP